MPDRPDYTKPIAFALQEVPDWGRRDWAAKEAEFKYLAWELANPAEPRETGLTDLYTVPTAKRLYLTDAGLGAEFQGVLVLTVSTGTDILSVLVRPWESKQYQFSVPVVISETETLQAYHENWDVVAGKTHGFFLGWETAASKPRFPKTDDPEENFKLGAFNWAKLYILDNDEVLIIFGKYKVKKRSYLRYRSLYKKNEKKLASGIITMKEAERLKKEFKRGIKRFREAIEKVEMRVKKKYII